MKVVDSVTGLIHEVLGFPKSSCVYRVKTWCSSTNSRMRAEFCPSYQEIEVVNAFITEPRKTVEGRPNGRGCLCFAWFMAPA